MTEQTRARSSNSETSLQYCTSNMLGQASHFFTCSTPSSRLIFTIFPTFTRRPARRRFCRLVSPKLSVRMFTRVEKEKLYFERCILNTTRGKIIYKQRIKREIASVCATSNFYVYGCCVRACMYGVHMHDSMYVYI